MPREGPTSPEGKARALANLVRFKPGESGCPGGKPVGARNRLQGAFLNALAKDFDESGISAIKACRENDPSAYVRAIVALMPKELEITRPFDDLTDEQLDAAVLAVRTILAAQGADAGAVAAEGQEQAQGLSPVPEAG